MTSWTERIVIWGFSLVLTGLIVLLVILAGLTVEIYVHPYAAVSVYLIGGIFAASYLREMTKE